MPQTRLAIALSREWSNSPGRQSYRFSSVKDDQQKGAISRPFFWSRQSFPLTTNYSGASHRCLFFLPCAKLFQHGGGLRIGRIEAVGVFQHGQRRLVFTQHVERRAQKHYRTVEFRTQRHRFLQGRARFFVSTQAEVADSQVVPSFE